MTLLEEIKRVFAYVDSLHKAFSSVATLVGSLAPLVIPSRTLAWFIVTGVILGSVGGYYFTASRWHGKGRAESLKGASRKMITFFVCFLSLIVLLAILQPEIAARFELTRAIREFLLDATLQTNIVASTLAAISAYFLIGTIVLHSPRLWTARN